MSLFETPKDYVLNGDPRVILHGWGGLEINGLGIDGDPGRAGHFMHRTECRRSLTGDPVSHYRVPSLHLTFRMFGSGKSAWWDIPSECRRQLERMGA